MVAVSPCEDWSSGGFDKTLFAQVNNTKNKNHQAGGVLSVRLSDKSMYHHAERS